MTTKINGRTPEEIKKGLECCTDQDVADCNGCPYLQDDACEVDWVVMEKDALAYIKQLEEDKKRLQERICNQRRQLQVLQAMYEWALGRLQKANLNDRAHFQAWLRERGYDLKTMELPESKYQQLERERDQYKRERDAAVEDVTELMQLAQFCRHCKHLTDDGECTFDFAANKGQPWCWQWRGVQKEVE